MLLALGAVSSALDMLQSLTAKKSASASTSAPAQSGGTPDFFGTAAAQAGASQAGATGNWSRSGNLSPDTLGALLAAQGQQPASTAPTSRDAALKDLFSLLDADGNGQISKSEFEKALGAGGTNLAQADDVFGKMDKNGDGSVSLGEMSSSLKSAAGHRGHRHHADGAANSSGTSSDPLMQALDSASSTTTTNSDGSTTTSLTYADGSKVTLTTPAATAHASTATSSYNFVEQAIKREAQALSASTAASLSVSA